MRQDSPLKGRDCDRTREYGQKEGRLGLESVWLSRAHLACMAYRLAGSVRVFFFFTSS